MAPGVRVEDNGGFPRRKIVVIRIDWEDARDLGYHLVEDNWDRGLGEDLISAAKEAAGRRTICLICDICSAKWIHPRTHLPPSFSQARDTASQEGWKYYARNKTDVCGNCNEPRKEQHGQDHG